MVFRKIKEKRNRILALDLLRGSFLLIIFVDHIAWSPSIYSFISGESQLAASAAEGFFTISGVLVGYIYGRKFLSNPQDTVRRLLKRAGWLYLLAISFTCLYSFITLFLPPDTVRSQYLFPTFGEFFIKTITLQFDYGWADFLARYAIFMLFAPIAVWLIAKGRAWLVALISSLVWFFWRSTPFQNFTAWQILFFFAIIIGYYLPQIEQKAASIPRQAKRYLLISLYTTALITYVINIIIVVPLPMIASDLYYKLPPHIVSAITHIIDLQHFLNATILNRETMAPLRIAVGTMWFSALYIVYRRFEVTIDEKTRGALLTLGTNSLYVYGLQSFILFIMDIFLKPPDTSRIFERTVVTTIAITVIYILTYKRSYFTRLRRRTLGLARIS